MLKTKRKRVPVVATATRKSMTIPDQSLTIDEIAIRVAKGLPTNVSQRQPTYIDQVDFDFEKISRMDFGEKAALAAEQREQAEKLKAELIAIEREKREKEAEAKRKRIREKARLNTGIGILDNTMPVDTSPAQQGRKVSK